MQTTLKGSNIFQIKFESGMNSPSWNYWNKGVCEGWALENDSMFKVNNRTLG